MEILHSTTELPQLPGPLFLAIGAFDGVLAQPSWYQTSGVATFHPIGFVNSLDQMAARTGQVMASAPRSSGSSGTSGFGGGGSVGGGFGGGGGGGF